MLDYVWHDENGDSIYSFTILTYESDEYFSWLHHRTPAILETEDQVRDWLDYERVPQEDALKVIKKPKNLVWYEVSHAVNNTRNQSDLCNKRLDEVKAKGSILNWFKSSKNSPQKTEKSENSPKRVKKE